MLPLQKLLNVKQNNTLNSSKTLTVANQTEVPILHCVTITLNTAIEDDFRQFAIPFAVADMKYNFLGTPFFEENIQNSSKALHYNLNTNQQYTLTIQILHQSYPMITHTSHVFIELNLKHKYV